MAAEVDFGDLELFEAFDHPEESLPKPVHTRFKDDDGDEEDENGVGDGELRERLQQCEETIEQLRAENILPARWALSPGCVVGAVPGRARAEIPRGPELRVILPPRPRAENQGFGLQKLPRGLGADLSASGICIPDSVRSSRHPVWGRFLGLFQTVGTVRV